MKFGDILLAAVSCSVRRCRQSFKRQWHYIVPVLVNSALVLRWFDPGRYIGAGDVSPLIRNSLRAEAFTTWGHQLTGAGGTRSNAGRSTETLLVRVVESVGGDTLVAQRVLFAVVASVCAIGAVHLVRLVVDNKWSMAFAGVLAFVNPFVMLYVPNLIFPLALGTVGLLIGELGGCLLGRPHSVLRMALCSFPIAYLSVNPPLVVVTVTSTLLVVTVIAIFQKTERRSFVRFAATSVLPVAIFHMWWVVPTAHLFMSGGPAGVSFTADTSDTGWSWVNAQNDLHRIVTLTAHWGWEQYKPYSGTLDSSPWIFMRWVLPLGALAGLIVLLRSKSSPRRLLGAALACSGVVLIVIAQGIHGTFEQVNLFLIENIPGWWLFRDPASKFGPLLTLLYVVLFAVMLEALWKSRPTKMRRVAARIVRPSFVALGLSLAVVSFVHPYPILTGEVIPTQNRGVLPPSRVEVPKEWEEIEGVLQQTSDQGKVAIFPINDYYQVTTTWGYHGVDLANQFFSRPIIQAYPGGYFEANQAFSGQFQSLHASIVDADPAAVNHLSRALGVSHIIVRKDTSHDFKELDSQARQLDILNPIYSSAIADVYEVETEDRFESVEVVSDWSTSRPEDATDAVAWTGNDVVDSETSGPSHPNGFFWKPKPTGDQIRANVASGEVQAQVASNHIAVEETESSWNFLIRPDISIDEIELEDTLVSEVPKNVETTTYVKSGGVVQPLRDSQDLEIGDGEITLLEASDSTPLPLVRELDDCNNVDQRPLAEVKLSSVISEESIELTAAEHTACTIFSVPESSHKTVIDFSVEEIRDGLGRVCLWDHSKSVCEIDQRFTASTMDRPVTILADASTSKRSLYFHASYEEGSGGRQTVASYSLPRTSTVSRNERTISIDATSDYIVDSPNGEVTLTSTSVAPNLLEDFGYLQDCNKRTSKTLEEAGLEVTYHPSGVTLGANDHSACVAAPISAPPGATLDLAFEFDTLVGTAKPRFCVWQEIANECVATEILRSKDHTDNQYEAKVELREESGDALLFFYADTNNAATKMSYRNVRVIRDTTPRVHITPTQKQGQQPSYTSTKESSDRYRAELEATGEKLLVVLPESHDPGWQLTIPQGWKSEHVVANGYANAWFVTGDGHGTLTMVYRPSLFVAWAQKASLAVIVFLAANFVFMRLIRAKRTLTAIQKGTNSV